MRRWLDVCYALGMTWVRHALLAGVVLLAGCRGERAPPPNAQPIVERRQNKLFVPETSPLRQKLTVAEVKTEIMQRKLVTPAAVEADIARLAKISPPLAGRVIKVHVKFGDTVNQGSPLIAMSSPELVAAQSEYLKAQSAFAQAERTVARQKDLLEHGIGAQRELDQAETERDTARSELARAGIRLKLLGMEPGNLGGSLTVTSPIFGRVVDITTTNGQYQNDPATVLMVIADLSVVWVTANVQERDLRRVHVGDEAVASFAAYPGETFGGKVLFVGDLLDPETRTIKVRVAYENGKALFKPGMFATVTFKSSPIPELVVPTSAVVLSGEQSSVFVEVAGWTFERRTVEVGEQSDDKIEILRGLTTGDRIVTSNAVLLP